MPEELLSEMARRLVDEFDPDLVYLFGSHAWGEARSDSDLDLLVVVPASKESPARLAARGYGALEQFAVAKDIVVRTREDFDRLSRARSAVEHRIAHQGRLLYRKA